MRGRLGVLVPIVFYSGQLFGYGSGTNGSTHHRLTAVLFNFSAPGNLSPLLLDQTEYPDLHKFKQQIIDGSNSELSHRDPADPNTRYWNGNEGLWENLVRAYQHPTKAFKDAYTSIGYYIHLTEDSTIPAHDRVIFHGYPALYYVSPGGQMLDGTRYPALRSDGLEFVSGDYDLSTLPVVDISLSAFHRIPRSWSNTPQYYNSSSPTCQNVMRKLWLCDGEAAAPDHPDDYVTLCSLREERTWGIYSFPTARGCDYPQVGADLDWYPRHLYPTNAVEAPMTAHDMGRTALYLAIRSSSEALKRISSTLPPVVTSPASRIRGDFAEGVAMSFSIQVQDNRTQGVYLSLVDAMTHRSIRATVEAPGLPPTTADLDGSLRIPLTRQMDTALDILPWADQVSVTWDGALAGGVSRIAPGDQTLDLQVEDEDGNLASGVVLVSSPIRGPVITAQPVSTTVTAGQTATFTVTATGTAPLIYQWLRNDMNIAGATIGSFTTAPVTTADNGSVFEVRVSNAGGSVRSSSARLTVDPALEQELVVDGGFEAGTANWSGTTRIIGAWSQEPPHAGTNSASFLGRGRSSSQHLSQTVEIPDTVTSATLSFYLHIDSTETVTTRAYDRFHVRVLDRSGSVLSALHTYSNLDAAPGYELKTFDVTAYRGKTIRVNFKGIENNTNPTSFVIDDVSLLVR